MAVRPTVLACRGGFHSPGEPTSPHRRSFFAPGGAPSVRGRVVPLGEAVAGAKRRRAAAAAGVVAGRRKGAAAPRLGSSLAAPSLSPEPPEATLGPRALHARTGWAGLGWAVACACGEPPSGLGVSGAPTAQPRAGRAGGVGRGAGAQSETLLSAAGVRVARRSRCPSSPAPSERASATALERPRWEVQAEEAAPAKPEQLLQEGTWLELGKRSQRFKSRGGGLAQLQPRVPPCRAATPQAGSRMSWLCGLRGRGRGRGCRQRGPAPSGWARAEQGFWEALRSSRARLGPAFAVCVAFSEPCSCEGFGRGPRTLQEPAHSWTGPCAPVELGLEAPGGRVQGLLHQPPHVFTPASGVWFEALRCGGLAGWRRQPSGCPPNPRLLEAEPCEGIAKTRGSEWIDPCRCLFPLCHPLIAICILLREWGGALRLCRRNLAGPDLPSLGSSPCRATSWACAR